MCSFDWFNTQLNVIDSIHGGLRELAVNKLTYAMHAYRHQSKPENTFGNT